MSLGASDEVHESVKDGVGLRVGSALDWEVEHPNRRIRHKHAEIRWWSWCRCGRTTFAASVSGGSVRDGSATTLITPVEGLVLHFLGITSSGRRWNCAPRFVFVGAILAVPRGGRRSRLTGGIGEFRTLVGPMTGFSTLVAIALLRWVFGPGRLGLNQRKDFSSSDTGRGRCDIAEGCCRGPDVRSMTRRRPFFSVKLRTVRVFGLATNILERQFLGDHVSMGA